MSGLRAAAAGLLASLCVSGMTLATEGGYAVVVSKVTHDEPQWAQVVDALREKHNGKVIVYEGAVADALEPLRRQFPRYTCFVARPAEATRQFVADVHRLTRQIDDDPYTDTLWGILTGFDAANALRIAREREPLVVRKVAAGTAIALECCQEGVWYCELVQGRMVRKDKGQPPRELKGPADTTQDLAETLTNYHADLFVTSGHATERDWQIGYRYRNGTFRSSAGQLFAANTQGNRWPIKSPNPKVYLPIGNCLMGHIDGPDAMALAWMNSAGVHQMIGYTVPSWFGYAGWGCLDYFVEQPGRYSFVEAFFANQHALIHRLATYYPSLLAQQLKPGDIYRGPIEASEAASRDHIRGNEGVGLLFDRDVVAIYGDPAWDARMADGPNRWDQRLTDANGLFTFEITPKAGDDTFKTVNTNGSQRGGRPIVQFLPHRIKNVRLVGGQPLEPVITDDFILVPRPREHDGKQTLRITFRADPAD